MTVQSGQRGCEIEVHVSDAGRGIPVRERERIFRPFYRIEGARTESVAGTGIGLSIARELARLHGGDLEVVPAPCACFRLVLDCPPTPGDDA